MYPSYMTWLSTPHWQTTPHQQITHFLLKPLLGWLLSLDLTQILLTWLSHFLAVCLLLFLFNKLLYFTNMLCGLVS